MKIPAATFFKLGRMSASVGLERMIEKSGDKQELPRGFIRIAI